MAGVGSEDEDGGGLLTTRTKGIVQHFQKQVREYTFGIDNDLQVINEKIGQMEAAQISNNTKLAGLETTVARMDKSLAALLRCFMSSTRRRMISIEDVAKRMRTAQKIQVLIMLLTPKLRIEASDVYVVTVKVWVDNVHMRYITMTLLSVR
jgi:hypothetical protein